MSPRKTSKGWLENAVSEIWTISYDNSETVRDRMSHRAFRLVPTPVTLNDLERRHSRYFAVFPPNSTDFQADYITVVEDRPIGPNACKILSPSSSLPLLAKTMHPAARSLCDSWASCLFADDSKLYNHCNYWRWPSVTSKGFKYFSSMVRQVIVKVKYK